MCGPSGNEKNLASNESGFFNDLTNGYNQNFGEQQGVMQNLQNALNPIIAGGPNQQGFSASGNAALTTSAINNAATSNRNAQVIAQQGQGGNTGITTGGEKQLSAQIGATVGNNLSNTENQNAVTSAELGRSNFFTAESAEQGLAGLYNPTSYAGAANTAEGQAFNEEDTINTEKNQEEADIAGEVGGLAGSVAEGAAGGGGASGIISSLAGFV